ncbi:hypothetical protein HDU89_003121 [Geranomyces variabilis]|nr:hypothetical protein BDZ88DRAFT_450083 [Geranomyces variabilis]KAJ3138045.1 hypothetical protein HDU90_001521 [Geranomyces variabilis]KAJ3150343.1 hypothetical protein HDU89_003121 [Geranomyces variabilis]
MTDSDTSATGGDRKRPGAKKNPFIFDMAAHRKEKNRQAQKALRERRSQQALETQTELRALRSQVASLGHDRSLLRHENRQMQNLLALTISGWIPEVGQEMAKRSSHDDMMIAAKALAELGAGPIYEPSATPQLHAADHQGSMSPHVHDPHHHQRTSPQLAVAANLNGSAGVAASPVGPRAPATPIEHPSSPAAYSTPPPAAEPSPFPSPPQASSQQSCPLPPPPALLPPHHVSHGDVASPTTPATPTSTTANASGAVAAAPPAQVENCAEMMPCFVLKERILKYGRHIDLAALCNELVHRAVCHGNPWDPNDWTVPDDLFERFPGLR